MRITNAQLKSDISNLERDITAVENKLNKIDDKLDLLRTELFPNLKQELAVMQAVNRRDYLKKTIGTGTLATIITAVISYFI